MAPALRFISTAFVLRLEVTVGADELDAAYKRAAFFGDMRYRRIKDLPDFYIG